MAVTISDVARRAGVSPATVSRVLNGTGAVSEAKAARVRAVAEAVGYQPFGPARALRRQQTSVWAVIIADVENPFFTAVVRGIEDVARELGFRLVLGNSDEDVAREAAYLDIAIAERMAGVVIAVASTTESQLDPLLDAGVPVVAIDRRPTRHDVDAVLVDNRGGAREGVAHLLEAGYRRVACITGPTRLSTANERLDGWADAVGRADRSLVKRANFRQDGGYKAARTLLESASPPDALFVANNLMTLGALEAVRDAGLTVGRDVGIVGFDDAPWASLVEPKLTVIDQPTREIGRQAGTLLTTERTGERREVVLSPTLVVRGSSRR